MNHVAFDVAPDKIDAYRKLLIQAGLEVTEVINHDDSESQVSEDISESTFVRSLYFRDPDGIQLEFAAWTRALTEDDVSYEPPLKPAAAQTGT
jgi:catechol 2,3-dioxygenase-like lactoylglutathione lyase family enzyme